MVAGRNVRDCVADRLDHPRSLVPEHHRPAARPELAVGVAHVGMTNAGGRHAHEDLPALGGSSSTSSIAPAGPAGEGRRRGCASSDPVLLERVEVGHDAETRGLGRRDRPVVGDLERSRAAASLAARPTTRADRTAPRDTGRSRTRAPRGGSRAARSRWTTCAGSMLDRPARRALPACAQPSMPPLETTSGCTTSTPPRSDEVACLRGRTHHLAGGDADACRAAELCVALDVVRREWFLEPVDVQPLELAGELPSPSHGPSAE